MSLEDYEGLKAIGKGKFSVVYHARRRDERIVAVKKVAIVDITNEKMYEKCLKEVRLLQHLSIEMWWDTWTLSSMRRISLLYLSGQKLHLAAAAEGYTEAGAV